MTEDTLPTGGSPAASTMGARLWRRMLGWVRRYRLIRNLEISLAILALIVGTLTYLAMTPGANQDLTAREVQVLLLTDLVVLLGLTTRSEEHTSELQSLMRTSYAVFCLKQKNTTLQ